MVDQEETVATKIVTGEGVVVVTKKCSLIDIHFREIIIMFVILVINNIT